MKVAVIQLNAGADKKKNVERAVDLVKKAIGARAQWILLPEAFNYRGRVNEKTLLRNIAESIPGESTAPFLELAKKKNVFILAGSVCERIKGKRKVHNTSVLIDNKGKIAARYRKINLFDAVLGKKVLKESKYLMPGKRIMTAHIHNLNVGMTICYDLRFPALYRKYIRRGCHVITVPSCFTKETGKAHWETLLRARAIENLCYIVAPNQTGKDSRGISVYGHSMIISPWGEILARASANRQEIIFADINMTAVKQARTVLPSI